MHSFIFSILWCICASLSIVQSAAANSSVLHLAEAEKLALADDIEIQRRNLLHNAQAQRAISRCAPRRAKRRRVVPSSR
jgi:hypothetical protein